MADVSTDKLRKRIRGILKDADSESLSAKKVRMKLQDMFDTDLSSRKKEIDKLTMSLFMELEEKKKEGDKEEGEDNKEEEEEEEEQNGGNQSEEKEEVIEEEEEADEPPKKKSKTKEPASKKKDKKKRKDADGEDVDLEPLENDDLNVYDEEQKTLKLSDEELAKRLQSFEETGRRTRNRGTPKKKERKKSSGGNNGYSKPCVLSALLAELMGTEKLARNEVVKKMWEIVRERKLLDPKDRRFMICDDQLQKIFGRKRVQMFVMMKYLGSHVREEGSTLEAVITNSDIYDDEADDD